MKAKKKYKRGGKLPVKSGRPARTEASIREEHRKQTSGKSKPAVKIQNTPMERVADTGLKEKVYKEMSDEFSKSGQPRMTANQLAMATINMTYPAKVKKIVQFLSDNISLKMLDALAVSLEVKDILSIDSIIFLESKDVMSICSTGLLRKSFLLLWPKFLFSDIKRLK